MLLLAYLVNRQDVMFRSALSITIPLLVWSALILPASAAPPPKVDLTSRESLEILSADSVGR